MHLGAWQDRLPRVLNHSYHTHHPTPRSSWTPSTIFAASRSTSATPRGCSGTSSLRVTASAIRRRMLAMPSAGFGPLVIDHKAKMQKQLSSLRCCFRHQSLLCSSRLLLRWQELWLRADWHLTLEISLLVWSGLTANVSLQSGRCGVEASAKSGGSLASSSTSVDVILMVVFRRHFA